MLHFGSLSDDCRRIRRESPLVHNITNYVAMNFSANALLAVGASPIMSSEPDEMEEISASCKATAINIGCLGKRQIEAMRIAASYMEQHGKPWVLDPVGVGVSALRMEAARMLLEMHPAVVRGNASEIMMIAGRKAKNIGVDAAEDSLKAVDSAIHIALTYKTVVSVSGPVDCITDGVNLVKVFNGSPMMPRVTAMGCAASAITAAFLAVDSDVLSAASCAMAMMGVAGELAAAVSAGSGSLAVNFIDELYSLDPEVASGFIRYE